MLRIGILLLAGLLVTTRAARPAEPAFVAEFRALKAEVDAELEAYYAGTDKHYEAAKTEVEREAALKRMRAGAGKIQEPAAERAMTLVRPHAADPAAADALAWVAQRASPALAEEAAAALTKHHTVHPLAIDLAGRSRGNPMKWVEPLLRAQLAHAGLPKADRPRVLLSLAMHKQVQCELPGMLAEAGGELLADMKETYGPEVVAGWGKAQVAAEAEAIQLLEELAAKHGTETLAREPTYGAIAKSSVFEIRNLSVGKTAPDIRGPDTDGVEFALSDSRGRVVLLSFWGTWCGPCLAFVPHERELVARFAGKPFAIVGVNADPDKAALKAEVAKLKITWRSFWCGEKGPEGAIPAAWNVNGWPTTYVLDHRGVIRAKQLIRGPALDRLLEKLVAEAGVPK